MVVVDYSISERYCRDKYIQDVVQKRLQVLEDDAAAEVAVSSNFCPRLRQALTLLLRHKVGPLQLQVHLSDFQSSTSSPLPTDGSSSNAQPPRYDRFVLALPYFCEDLSTASSHINLVRWSIITQCDCPDKVPEVILLGVDYLSVDSAHGDASLHRPHSNQRSQHLLSRQQTHKIVQERYWQQYVASDVFHLPCLTKWEKINNDSSSVMQYCLLANQLYECYCQFQLYKLKMSLKSVSTMQPPPQLIEAYTQYKQLVKLSKSTTVEDVGTVTTAMCIELLVELEDSLTAKEYEDRRKQKISSGVVQMRVIISLEPTEPTMSFPNSTESAANQNLNYNMLNLAVVNTTFPISVTPGSNNKNSPKFSKNKYVVRIINPNINTTHQQDMVVSMLETASDPVLDTTTVDFVTYVRRVQHVVVKLYNCKMETGDREKLSSEKNDYDSNRLVLESFFKMFCDSPSNGNYLLDYQINNHDTPNKQISFIRFLLVDGDVSTETLQLKYILTIELSKEIFDKLNNLENVDNTDTAKMLVPVVALRSVYDDESCGHYLNINLANLMTDQGQCKDLAIYDELAKIIRTETVSAMKQLRHNVLTPVLTRYNRVWSPTDSYFIRSSQKPPSYPLP